MAFVLPGSGAGDGGSDGSNAPPAPPQRAPPSPLRRGAGRRLGAADADQGLDVGGHGVSAARARARRAAHRARRPGRLSLHTAAERFAAQKYLALAPGGRAISGVRGRRHCADVGGAGGDCSLTSHTHAALMPLSSLRPQPLTGGLLLAVLLAAVPL